MRLLNTIILYDGMPYYVVAICNHKPDGIFRMYLDPLRESGHMLVMEPPGSPKRPPFDCAPKDHPQVGEQLDLWMSNNPGSGLERKMMNSPKFNKFRPFPLGMLNHGSKTSYVTRHPTRNIEQGLTKRALLGLPVTLAAGARLDNVANHFMSPAMFSCIVGKYPDPKECFERLQDPDVSNDAVGFSRDFALARGPLETLFLSYRGDTVGFLPNRDSTRLRLGRKYPYLREACGELGIFDKIELSQ